MISNVTITPNHTSLSLQHLINGSVVKLQSKKEIGSLLSHTGIDRVPIVRLCIPRQSHIKGSIINQNITDKVLYLERNVSECSFHMVKSQ